MTTTNPTNGKAPTTRKQLSDQLDRLDGIIDTLAEGLNQAVADACREGAKAAVREVILELISNPDLLAAVRSTVPAAPVLPVTEESTAASKGDEPPQPPVATSFWCRARECARSAVRVVVGAARTQIQSVAAAVPPAADALKLTGTTRAVIAVALGVGLAAGAASLVCPTWVSAVVTGATGAAAVVAGHVGATVNAVFARLQVSD